LGGVNKGTSINYIANKLGIKKEQIAAIGDSNNDLAAFESASLKIAVKSKSKKLIEASSIYLSYSRNAVADAIRNHILAGDKSIQLIASDLDGTLLKNGSKTIAPETKNNIEKAVNDLNKKFVICTGRNIDDILLVADYLNIKNRNNLFAIGANGCFIYDIENKRYIFEKLMSEDFAKKVMAKFNAIKNDNNVKGQLSCEMFVNYKAEDIVARKPQIHYCINRQFIEDMYKKYHPGMFDNFWAKRFSKDIDEKTPFNKVMKFIFYFESQDDRARMFAAFNEFKGDLEISSSGKHNVEVMPMNITKGRALQRLCDYLKIDIKDTMPIGDEKNDISMLSLSPHSVTLKTSSIEVQQSAGNVLDQSTSDVVGKAIELFVIRK
jgi:Cof subfamily protein (haloacid dehalogenase superfamily)